MKLRTFTASDMPAAMKLVREALGDDAIILSHTADASGRKITVTAALEEPEEVPPPSIRTASALRGIARAGGYDWADDLAQLLRYHNTPESLSGRLQYKARHMELDKLFALQKFGSTSKQSGETKALARLLGSVFRFEPLSFETPQRLMLIGASGAGKTLAIAKLAAALSMDRAPLTVISIDQKRAGGVEQLAAFTDILELPLHTAETPEELSKILRSTPREAHVLIDSFGCNAYAKEELEELTAFIAIGGFEPVLTLPAGVDSFEAADSARAFAFSSLTRLFITKTDAARRFGSVLSALDARPLALSHFSGSSRVVEELLPASPESLAQLMLRYRINEEK